VYNKLLSESAKRLDSISLLEKKYWKREMKENSADGFVIKDEANLDFDDLLFTSFILFLTVTKMHQYQTTITLCGGHPYNTIL
jgi:hypothetical protein